LEQGGSYLPGLLNGTSFVAALLLQHPASCWDSRSHTGLLRAAFPSWPINTTYLKPTLGGRLKRQPWQAWARPSRLRGNLQAFRLPVLLDHSTPYRPKHSPFTHRIHIPPPSQKLKTTYEEIRKHSKSSSIGLLSI